MKSCFTCKESKPLTEFGNTKSSPDGKQPYCKLCGREKDRRHYHRSSRRKTAIRADSKFRAERAKAFILSYFETHPCVDCGNGNPVVLEFDHLFDKSKTSAE